MIVLSGAHLVLPDRILTPGTLVIDGDRIVDVRAGALSGTPGEPGENIAGSHAFAFDHHYIVPGFIDVHVHGVEGFDTLDVVNIDNGGNPVAAMATRLPRYGVTAFCPTTVACAPDTLARLLRHVRQARKVLQPHAARVLPAHLESNFISAGISGRTAAGVSAQSPRGAARGAASKPRTA